MIRLVSNLLYRLWQVMAFLIILIAVLIAIGRLVLPFANQYRTDIETLLSSALGRQVQIGEISTEWKSLGPSISIHQVEIDNLLYIGSVEADIKTIPSIFYRSLITDNLSISGVNLIIHQQADGQFDIADSEQSKQSDSESFLDIQTVQDWLQSQSNILVQEANLQISLRQGLSYPIHISQMAYARGADQYQIRGFTELPGDNRIDFVLEADGYLSDPATMGTLFIDTHTLDLTKLPLSAFWQEAKIAEGKVSMKTWFDWRNLGFQSAIAKLEVNDFLLTLQDVPQGDINKISTQLIWQRLDDGWQLQTHQAEVRSHQRDWPDPTVLLRMRSLEGNSQHYLLQSSQLDIGVWADLVLAKQDLQPELRSRLLAMNPQGFLEAVQIEARLKEMAILDFNLNGRFSELSFQSYNQTPGVKNLSGQVQINEDSGRLYLDSRYAEFHDPQLFRWQLPLDYLNADVRWKLTEENLDLIINRMTSQMFGATLKADGKFTIPLDDGQMVMNLYAELINGDMSKTRYFLPSGIMEPELVTYLDRAVIDGELTKVKVLLRGNATDFPYNTTANGVFAIHGFSQNASYQFQPDWPALENMSADLYFIGNSMDIQLQNATSVGHQINSARAVIPDFSSDQVILEVVSSSHGDLKDAPSYVTQSPLMEDLEPLLNAIDMSGPFGLSLAIDIPLEEGDPLVSGEILLQDVELLVKDIDLPATEVNGSIQINNNILSSKDISASLLGSSSRINLNQTLSEGQIETEIKINGELTMDGVYQVFADQIPTGLKGNTPYQAEIQIPAQDKDFNVELQTRTEGLVSDIPHPLSKTADIGLPLKLNYSNSNATNGLLELEWLEKLKLIMAFSDGELSSGVIALGTDQAVLSERPGIEITGVADQLDLVAWLDYLSELDDSGGSDTDVSYADYYLNDLSIKQLNYFFLTFDETKVSGQLSDTQMDFVLAGTDITGQVHVPLPIGSKRIELDLDRIQIDDQFLPGEESRQTSNRVADADPLPAIRMTCKSCFYTDFDIGSTEAVLSPLENGNKVSIKVSKDNILSMDVTGQWTADKDQNVLSELTGSVQTKNLGRLMTILHQETGIRDTPMKLTGNLSWLGDPSMFNTETLSGNLAADGGKGSQRQLSDKGARLFTLFSLGSIFRKLTLDFSDLFQSGFFYTSMKGDFDIKQGVFNTKNFKVKGTSADVQVVGKTDFTNRHIEQCILVTPDLSSSLPVLAGWAIEPVTGFVVFLMSKLFQPALDVVSSIRYQVEGSFDDPIVSEIGKSRATATITEDEENPSITVEESEKPFSCDDQFEKNQDQ